MMGTFTGNPNQFDGKNPWVSGEDFPAFCLPGRRDLFGGLPAVGL